ncbi:Cytochrome b561 and DOMON domain-containing protein [Vitis vinifera]|uniref:Cytochrome b561 and DOMON domain-containing protein n=1 Tax=Vitis vinifera TaxID=29760 RepID=A0A438DQ38_VITVI|nr:Cytochrome b561 and DOMON domain-containing protein [Vitis vinifera]
MGHQPNFSRNDCTHALIAYPDPNTGLLVVLPYVLDPTVKLQRSPLLSRPLDLHLLSSSAIMYGGRMATVHNGAAIQIYATLKLVRIELKYTMSGTEPLRPRLLADNPSNYN